MRVTDLSDSLIGPAWWNESDSVLDLQPGQNGQVRFTATEGTRYRVSAPGHDGPGRQAGGGIFAPDG